METLEPPSVNEPPTLSETHLFLDKVLCDGRYLDDFQQKPEAVAQLLCIQISPVAAEEVSNSPRDQLLPKLFEAKFALQRPYRHSAVAPALAIGIVIVVGVIVIIIGITIVTVIRRDRSPGAAIKDLSPHKDTKL
jgi:hypothetical protein